MKKGICLTEVIIVLLILIIIGSLLIYNGLSIYVISFFIFCIFGSIVITIFDSINKKNTTIMIEEIRNINNKKSLLNIIDKYKNSNIIFNKKKNKLDFYLSNGFKIHSIEYLDEYKDILNINDIDELYNFDINESKENKVKRILKMAIVNKFMIEINKIDEIKLEDNIVDFLQWHNYFDSVDIYDILIDFFNYLNISFEDYDVITLNDVLNQIEDEDVLNNFLEKEHKNYIKN